MRNDATDAVVPPCPYEGQVESAGAVPAPKGPKSVPELTDPPRRVPMLVWASNLTGGFANQFAWVWLGVTGVFLWVFMPNCDVAGLFLFRGDLATAAGKVTASEETNFAEDDVDVYAHTYRFAGPDGAERESVSYETGRQLDAGTDVTVEYLPADPVVSRIRGMRRKPFGVEGLGGVMLLGGLGLFVVIGLVFLVIGVRKGLKANRLLANGRFALGRLNEKRATSTRINDQTVWACTFEFQAGDGRTYQATAKTHQVDRLLDPRGEFLLYDPAGPARAVLFDNIPGAVRISERGTLETDPSRKVLGSLVVPAVALSVHAVIAWFVLL